MTVVFSRHENTSVSLCPSSPEIAYYYGLLNSLRVYSKLSRYRWFAQFLIRVDFVHQYINSVRVALDTGHTVNTEYCDHLACY